MAAAHLHLSYFLPSSPPSLEGEQQLQENPDCPSSPPNCSDSGYQNATVALMMGTTPTYISIASCSLSCMGSVLIFITYFALKGIRNVAQKIITLLALADFFTAAGYLLAGWNYLSNRDKCSTFADVCEVQSFITSWSSICSFGWNSALALHLYLLLSAKRKLPLSKFLIWENVLIWIFPLIILLPLLITDKLGYSHYAASNWCFIRRQPDPDDGGANDLIALVLVGGKLWELLSYLFVVLMYTLTTLKLNKLNVTKQEQRPINHPPTPEDSRQISPQGESRADVKQRLLLIPILFILLRIWGTLQFFFALVKSREVQERCVSKGTYSSFLMLSIAQAIGDGGQGWSNALLYIFLSPTIRQQLFTQPLTNCLYACLEKFKTLRGIELEAAPAEEGRWGGRGRDSVAPAHMIRRGGRGNEEGVKLISDSQYDSEAGLRSMADSGVSLQS